MTRLATPRPTAVATATANPPNNGVLCLHQRSRDGCDVAPTRRASARHSGVHASAASVAAIIVNITPRTNVPPGNGSTLPGPPPHQVENIPTRSYVRHVTRRFWVQ